jgi:hypothetical protein
MNPSNYSPNCEHRPVWIFVAFNIERYITDYVLETTRTYVGKITNHRQVEEDLDKCGFSASKLWNVGRSYVQQRWDEDGEIPDESELKSELKDHERMKIA